MKMPKFVFLIIMCLSAVTLFSHCNKEGDDVDSGNASIRGRITFKSATTGLVSNASGAEVYLLQRTQCSPTNEYDLAVRADGSGNYRFDNLVSGSYVIDAFYEGTIFSYEGFKCANIGKRENKTLNIELR